MAQNAIPKVVLVMKPVDGGRATIGILECPHCGETHYTTQIECGDRQVFCGSKAEAPYNAVSVTAIL